jgi:hypothetical protein
LEGCSEEKGISIEQMVKGENLNRKSEVKENKLRQIKNEIIYIEGKFKSGLEYEYIWKGNDGEKKFIVDNMLFKLVKYFRNIGIDTAYTGSSD